jgi:hypothetical protein
MKLFLYQINFQKFGNHSKEVCLLCDLLSSLRIDFAFQEKISSKLYRDFKSTRRTCSSGSLQNIFDFFSPYLNAERQVSEPITELAISSFINNLIHQKIMIFCPLGIQASFNISLRALIKSGFNAIACANLREPPLTYQVL